MKGLTGVMMLYRFSIEKIPAGRQKEVFVYSKNRIFRKNPVFLKRFMPEKFMFQISGELILQMKNGYSMNFAENFSGCLLSQA